MRIRTAYISFCIALFYHVNAFAAKNVEIVRYPSLFMVESFSQSVGLGYTYAGHSNSSSSTSSSALSETYGLKTIFDILDPHLANIQLDGSVAYRQQFGQKTSTLLDGSYSLMLTAFDLEYYPVVFFSTRTETLVANGYVPPYTLTTTVNRVRASLLSKLLPVTIDYGHGASQTSGLPKDSRSNSDSWNLSASHVIPDVSDTTLTGGFGISRSFLDGQESDTFNTIASLENVLTLDKKRDYLLNTVVSGSESKAGSVKQSGYAIQELLNCNFGKALAGNLGYQHTYSSTVDFNDNPQSTQADSVFAGLSHRLFNSLATGVSGSVSQSSMLGGSVTSYGGATNVTYSKQLPARVFLRVSGGVAEQFSDQKFSNPNVDVRDESHVVSQQGESIKPDTAGTLVSVLTVRSLNADGITYTVYVPEVDYHVNPLFGTIEIIRIIPPGTSINFLISYRVTVNPTISFSNTSVLTSGSLSFLDGRYNLAVNYATQKQSLISGQAKNQLTQSSSLNIRGDARYLTSQFGAEYGSIDTSGQKASHFAAYWSTKTSYTDLDSISLLVRDAYTINSSTSSASDSQSNSISASGSYSRTFFERLRTSFSVSAVDSRDNRGNTSDFLNMSGTLDASFHSASISLSAGTMYRFGAGQVRRDDNLGLTFTRYF